MLGEPRGTYTRVHPNDHVNMGQSTNDVFPTATRLALLLGAAPLVARGARAGRQPRAKGRRVRRRAQDRPHASAGCGADHARPGVQRLRGLRRAAAPTTSRAASEQLRELNIGATAVGTGLNAGDDYRRLVVAQPARATPNLPLDAGGESVSRHAEHGRRARLLGRDAAARGRSRARSRAICGCSAWARAPGLSEIALPAVQPGSSIMPGKVNPSVPEMVNQVCFQVMGCDTTVAHRLRGRTARAERDDAGHRLERAARVDDSARGDEGAPAPLRRRHRRRRGARARAARSQHRDARPRSARTSATRRPPRSRRNRSKTGRSIRELVLERGLLDADAARRDPVGGGDDARGNRRAASRRAGRAGEAGRRRWRAGRVVHAAASCLLSCASRAACPTSPRLPDPPDLPDQPAQHPQPKPKGPPVPAAGSRAARSARSR